MKKIVLAKDVDEYIAMAPKDVQSKLLQLRKVIRSVAPESSESIGYGMPYYKYHGMVASFGFFKSHIGFFGALVEKYEKDLKGYETSKGTVRFPLDKPLPVPLIKKLVKARVLENKRKMK